MKLYNSRTREIEDFKSIEPRIVKMYSCGPTVYDHVHIGNLRSFTFADLLKKSFKLSGYSVRQIMNITDFGHLVGDGDDGEDKMSVGLKREGLPRTLKGMRQLADKYTELFKQDISKMNIEFADDFPRASENIGEYVKIIENLGEKGFIYTISDGIYFDTSKDPNYGKMALLDRQKENKKESRIGEKSEKRNMEDFCLWKFASKDNGDAGFETRTEKIPFGFPGWHIECSGMAIKYLGETFDIHTGGIDLLFPHHTNEIAQSENYTGKIFSNFFCHNAFIDISNEKMSKSKNNFFTLQTILEKNYSPLAYRYLILQAHYRQNLNFTWEALEASQNALKKLKNHVSEFSKNATPNADEEIQNDYLDKFKAELEDDLNTPQALATLWTLVKDEEISDSQKYFTIKKMDEVFSLDLTKEEVVSEEIQVLLNKREEFRKEKNFAEADAIRDQLKNLGYEVKDK